jgi:hypothetical protein
LKGLGVRSLFRKTPYYGLCGPDQVRRLQDHLEAPESGTDRDFVKTERGFIDQHRIGFSGSKRGHAASLVTRQGEDLLQRDQLASFVPGKGCGGFQIQFPASWNDAKEDASFIASKDQRFKNTVERHPDLQRNAGSPEVVRVDFVLCQPKGDPELFELANRVGFLQKENPPFYRRPTAAIRKKTKKTL